MKYQVVYSKKVLKQLKKMDKQIAMLIISYIEKNLVNCSNPRLLGKSLKGNLNNKWSYRIGNYRILSIIEDGKILINIVEIGHRRDIYN